MSKRGGAPAAARGGPVPVDPASIGAPEDAPPEQPVEAPTGPTETTFYDSQGNAVEGLTPDQQREGYLSGQLFVDKTQPLAMRDPRTGRILQVDPNRAEEAFQSMAPATGEQIGQALENKEYATLGKTVKSFGAGALSGATFGLSDLALSQDEGTRQELEKLRQHHPYANMAGQLAGATAPMLLSGGAGALGEAAEFAPTTLVGKLGAGAAHLAEGVVGEGATSVLGRVAQSAIPLAAQGAAEGAFYGAGNVISENAIGGQEITAEKLLAGAKDGAVTGFLAGAGLGAAGSLAKSAVEGTFKLAGADSLKAWLQDIADQQTMKAVGIDKVQYSRLGRTAEDVEQRVSEIADTVRNAKLDNGEKVFKPFTTASETADRLAIAERESGERLGKITDKIEAIAQEHPEARPNIPEFLQTVDDKVLSDLRSSGIAEVRKRADRVENVISELREKAANNEAVSFAELRDFRQDFDSLIYQERADAGAGVRALPNPRLKALEQTRSLLEDTIEKSADRAAAISGDAELQGAYQAEKSTFRDLRQAKEMAEKWEMRDMGNRMVSPSDYGVGVGGALAAAASGVGGIASGGLGLAMTAAHNVIRERGASIMAHIADRAANINALSHAAVHVDSSIIDSVAEFLHEEAPRTGIHTTSKIVEHTADERRKAFDKVSEQLAEVTGNPQAAAAKVAEHVAPLAQQAPGVASKVASTLLADAQYLQSKMPRTAGAAASLQPQFDKNRVSDLDLAKFNNIRRALDNPLTVLDDMKAGKMPPREVVQTLKDRRPEIFQQIQGEVMKQLAGMKEKLPRDKALQVGRLFGVPMDKTATPQFISGVQATYKKMGGVNANRDAAPGAPAKTHPVPQGLDLAENTMTGTQGLESR